MKAFEPASERILIVEDEPAMRRGLEDCLASQGYRVMAASDGEAGLKKALSEEPDLILLDVMMPRLDGFALCVEIRKHARAVPILFLTAKGQVNDRVRGLDSGGDDYLIKPFSTEELLARVRSALRRNRSRATSVEVVKMGDLTIDFVRQKAARRKKAVHLTAKEFAVLRLMMEARGEPVSRERFLDLVWGYGAFPTTRTVDNHVASLRAKIERNPDDPAWIKTVHGVGYRLEL